MSSGKTIQIYLPDGNPRGIKIAEITSRTVQAMSVPRSLLDDAIAREELANVCVYFLVGAQEDGSKAVLYIGEAEDARVRLKQHNKSKDFWSTAVVITSKTQFFTKTHVKYLEWFCHAEAEKAGRYKLENASTPSKPHVPEPVVADLMDNFETIRTLLATLGYPAFDRVAKPKKQDVLKCKGKEAVATGVYTEDGLTVFAGSTCNLVETKTAGSTVRNRRKMLIEDGVLIKQNKVLKFTADYTFATPSAAANAVLARRSNGWAEWKFPDGRSLDEVVRQKDTQII